MTLPIRSETALVGVLGVAAAVSAISVLKVLVANPEQLGLDLPSYLEGARRLVESGTPYSPELHAGPLGNVSSNIAIGYFYPPPLAQLFVPILGVPMPMLAWAWGLSQTLLLLILLPVVYRRFSGRAPGMGVVAVLLGAVAFTPNLVALYIGNLSGWIAILIALMLVVEAPGRAASAAAAMWLKLTPGVFAAGALIDRSTRSATLAACLAILAVSMVLSAAAWADWIAVLPSIAGLSEAPYTSNLAPAHVLASAGFAGLAEITRIALPALFGVLLLVSAWRGNLGAWVASATGVYLTASGTSWDHYFAALSPLASAAWPRASAAVRCVIIGGLVWYGPLRFFDTQSWYQVIGLGLWLTFLLGTIIQFNGGAALWRHRPSIARLTSPVGSPN